MEELEHLRRVFHANGYPRKLIQSTLNQPPHVPHDLVQTMEPQTKLKTLCLLYVRHLSEEIQRLCKDLDIRVVFRPCNSSSQKWRPQHWTRRKLGWSMRFPVWTVRQYTLGRQEDIWGRGCLNTGEQWGMETGPTEWKCMHGIRAIELTGQVPR